MGWSTSRKRFYPTLLEEPERFWAKVERREPHQCWPWKGCTEKSGYGRAGKRERAHRIAYMLANGQIPAGAVVRHACDNPPCCNPAHLSIGSHGDNSRDSVERGRHYTPFSREERQRHGFAPGGPCRP